jgi:hypothetical protein
VYIAYIFLRQIELGGGIARRGFQVLRAGNMDTL